VVRRREEQIAVLQLQQRLEIAALAREDLGGLTARYVGDEIGLLLDKSPRQGHNVVEGAQLFADFPAVHARIADGTWLMPHADAVVDELVCTELTRAQQDEVLDLVLERCSGRRTPWELRSAVRSAVLVLFPEATVDRAKKAAADRDVRCHAERGGASLLAFGPAQEVAEMMACLDTMAGPCEADDARSIAQRRFDVLHSLVCGRVQPGQWQAQVLITLASAEGQDELPAEVVGLGSITAAEGRAIIAGGAELRRVVMDDHGQLVTVDDKVHRPDLAPPVGPERIPAAPTHDDESDELLEPDEDPVDAFDTDWVDANTDGGRVIQELDRQSRMRAPAPVDLGSHANAGGQEDLGPGAGAGAPAETPLAPSYPAYGWSAAALALAFHRIRTGVVHQADLSTSSYAATRRLKRHLELRDKTCIWPGCPRLAKHSDKDHLIPWPRGSTSEKNLADECEHHHQAKHDCFTVVRLSDGTFRWTTPCGKEYDRAPRPVLDAWLFRLPRCA
jgi:hypothetical protein